MKKQNVKKIAAKQEKRRRHHIAVEMVRLATQKVLKYKNEDIT